MGGFFLAVKAKGVRTTALADRARHEFLQSGLGDPVRIDDTAYVLDYYPKHGQGVENLVRLGKTDFILNVGTLIYRKRSGAQALHLIANSPDLASTALNCAGHFALIMRRGGQTSFARDPLGAYEIYHDENFNVITTSFLALAACLPRRSIRSAECIEYVLNGVTFGTRTPIHEIRRLGLDGTISFAPTPRVVRREVPLLPEESSASLPRQLQHSISVLGDYTQSFIEAFRGKVALGFSGGYDSRLMLALLRAYGVTPSLFVYGAKDSPDVRIAKEIADGERIQLQHVDKALFRPVTLDSLPEMVRQNFYWNDGFSQFGIFSSNAENILRAERSLPPGVVLNGGGGEVFRNYFKFSGRNLSVRNFVRSFFSHFDPRILADPSLHALFENGLSAKIIGLLGLQEPVLNRRQVECLYPHLRCHSWFGRANSIDNKFGNVVLPYYDKAVVDAALSLPVEWKNFGNFQGRMIHEVDPRVASYRSSHGFSFDTNTPLKAMAPDLLLYALPPAIRRYNYQIKQKLLTQPPRRKVLTDPFLARVIDPRFPTMRRLFNVQRVRDNGQLNRLASLEYLFQQTNTGFQKQDSQGESELNRIVREPA